MKSILRQCFVGLSVILDPLSTFALTFRNTTWIAPLSHTSAEDVTNSLLPRRKGNVRYCIVTVQPA